jgi:hypothetical protein
MKVSLQSISRSHFDEFASNRKLPLRALKAASAVESELEPIQVCHCMQCRKAQGGAFAAVIPVAVSAFHLLSAEHLLKSHESSPGKQRVFCACCGSPIYRRPSLPSVVRVRAGLFNEPLPVKAA